MNFTELRFTSDDAMQRYLADIETIWTPAVMEELAGLVLKRKSITRISVSYTHLTLPTRS